MAGPPDSLEEQDCGGILHAKDIACSHGCAGWVFAFVEVWGGGLFVQAGGEDEDV